MAKCCKCSRDVVDGFVRCGNIYCVSDWQARLKSNDEVLKLLEVENGSITSRA